VKNLPLKKFWKQKFLGKIVLKQKELQKEERVKKWFPLKVKGKKKERDNNGQLFVNLSNRDPSDRFAIEASPTETELHEQPAKKETSSSLVVVDRLSELVDTSALRMGMKLLKADNSKPLVVEMGAPSPFKLKMDTTMRIILAMEKDTKNLQEMKERSSSRRDKENKIDQLLRRVERDMEVGVKWLRVLGMELNRAISDTELRQNMIHSNYLTERFMAAVDEFNKAKAGLMFLGGRKDFIPSKIHSTEIVVN